MEVPQPAPTETPAPTPAPDASMNERLAGLVEQARVAHQRFEARKGAVRQVVVSGASLGSEAWARSSVAIAELESARSEAMIALADLDGMLAATQTGGGDPLPITAAIDQVSTWIGSEDRDLAAMRGSSAGS